MKLLTLAIALMATPVLAKLPTGKFTLEKIQCSTGKTLKLGGKFMVYKVNLDITDSTLKMSVTAKSGSWAPFKLNCVQINNGKYSLIGDSQYSGYLSKDYVKCNAKAWEDIVNKKGFGVEKEGVFNYTFANNKLVIKNPNTVTKYSCDKENGYPIYHYIRN